MGTLQYGSPGIEVHFDDRVLMHLQIVITTKLRRREGFVFTWNDSVEAGSGRNSVWLHPAIPIYYRYSGSRLPVINREWIETLMTSANSGGGLLLTQEPGLGGVKPRQ